MIEILVHKGAFKQGEEQAEAQYLWDLVIQRGLNAPFDEVWFVGIMPSASVGADRAGPYPVPYADPNSTSPNGLTSTPARTRGRRKGLLLMLIALVILLIIGSAGTFFFYARNHATDQAYPGYLSGHGALAFFDPLSSQQDGRQWSTYNSHRAGLSCEFTSGAYHASTVTAVAFTVCSPVGIFSNFALEVQLTITQGDCGGIIFRTDGQGHFYEFLLCENGAYQVLKYIGNASPVAAVLSSGNSPAIHTGLGQQNKIAVVASGSAMICYVNEQPIGSAQDSSYTSGQIALIAYPSYGHATDVAYRNARLWTL